MTRPSDWPRSPAPLLDWVIIAGGRDITNLAHIQAAVDASGWSFRGVITGKQRGVDTLGEQWARERAFPVKEFPADWVRYGPRAGRLRNLEMAQVASALIAVWDGRSPGTKHMIDSMMLRGKPTFIYRVTA